MPKVYKKNKINKDENITDGGMYFEEEKPPKLFINSGCELLNCVLSGSFDVGDGYPLGRIVNIVGSQSSNKTGLAIEACANFIRQYPNGKVVYHEAEAAFDEEYARTLGMPVDDIEIEKEIDTVEGLFDKLIETIEEAKDTPILYIVDSLDALTDKAEKGRKIDEGSFAMNKQKKLSEMFRRLVKDIERSNMCLIIISQIRDKVGVMFGEKHSRSGGKALDFYASQIIWLTELGKIQKTIKGIKRPIGISIKAKAKKNKVSAPYRDCEFDIIFSYGIDDVKASIEWLSSVKGGLDPLEINPKTDINEYRNDPEMVKKIACRVREVWKEVEADFAPKIQKYI
jgi:recombination protein RecA